MLLIQYFKGRGSGSLWVWCQPSLRSEFQDSQGEIEKPWLKQNQKQSRGKQAKNWTNRATLYKQDRLKQNLWGCGLQSHEGVRLGCGGDTWHDIEVQLQSPGKLTPVSQASVWRPPGATPHHGKVELLCFTGVYLFTLTIWRLCRSLFKSSHPHPLDRIILFFLMDYICDGNRLRL